MFCEPSSGSKPSTDLSMQQTNAPDASGSVSVRISSVAPQELELSTESDSPYRDDSSDMKSFADLARVADR
eukprot:4963529-Pyramimonas_sp.AAC.1